MASQNLVNIVSGNALLIGTAPITKKHSLIGCLFMISYSNFVLKHYDDVIMTTMASQITSLTIVYLIVYSGTDQINIKAPHHWPLCGEFTGDRWIPRTKGQLRGKCFHLMTSSWSTPCVCNCSSNINITVAIKYYLSQWTWMRVGLTKEVKSTWFINNLTAKSENVCAL